MSDDIKLVEQKLDNVLSLMKDMRAEFAVATKQFQAVAVHLQKKTDNWERRIDNWPFAWPSSKRHGR